MKKGFEAGSSYILEKEFDLIAEREVELILGE